MAHPLEGIAERLKRADENILNVDSEIKRFLKETGNPEVVYRELKAVEEFRQFWSHQTVPPRFGVLISEILHHYRSALDNLVWELLRQAGHSPKNPNLIEFPIFGTRPTAPDKISKFNRKIEGVSSAAYTIIESLQPYNAVSQWKGPHFALLVLHDMNRFDKHRELSLTNTSSQQKAQANLVMLFRRHKDPATGNITETPVAYREVYMGLKLTALIAFRKFGNEGPNNFPVIPGLKRIQTAVNEAIRLFDGFFPQGR
jgi:hypothetical protein